jgi:diguanylate cyclase (GGDEF)-like protein
MSAQPSTIAIKLKRIREAYLKQLPTQLEVIRETLVVIDRNKPAQADLEDLHRRIHTLKGASASFGLNKVAAIADVAESLAKGVLAGEAADGAWRRQMEGHFAKLAEQIAAADQSQETDLKVQEMLAAAEMSKNRSDSEKKMIFLCEDDPFQRQSFATQIGCFGFEVISFDKLDSLRDAVKTSPPDAIVMDMTFPDRPEGGGEVIGELRSQGRTVPPTVFISSQNDLTYRLSAVRAGSSAYFVKPLNIVELCSKLHAVTSAVQSEPYRVMIIDDDVNLANYHALFLQEAGMVTLTVDNPLQQMMDKLLEFKPDLILMDMYMPGCNGMELANVIRQIGAYFSIPIVFLSSETDADKQFHAMRMGGDEFLTKPIKPEHLVSAVAVRAERMKIIRAQMVRDSLTGLLNHSNAVEHLELAVAQAKRQGGELCLAVIDLDKFKEVNDTYGHPSGDRVLIALAQLLTQRLRKADIVGRIGGEEFAAILPDCNLTTALSLFEQLRQSFAAIEFPADKENFTVTLSCGIASLSQYGGAVQLHKAADEALYLAKKGGRNKVLGDGGREP